VRRKADLEVLMATHDLKVIFPGGRLHLVRRASPTNFYCHLEDALPCVFALLKNTKIFSVIPSLGVRSRQLSWR
jgi:hypothetical protein